MFPRKPWDLAPTVGWEFPPSDRFDGHFPQFSGIGTLLD
jgi:hypothetical protein